MGLATITSSAQQENALEYSSEQDLSVRIRLVTSPQNNMDCMVTISSLAQQENALENFINKSARSVIIRLVTSAQKNGIGYISSLAQQKNALEHPWLLSSSSSVQQENAPEI